MTLPLAAATGVTEALADIFVILLAAKLGDELFKRLRQPTLIGELLAGLLVGPAVLGLVEPGETLEVFAELGVVFLLFYVGLDTRLSQLREVGRAAISVGVLGVAMFTGNGASGVTGAGFITLAATLAVIPSIPVAGLALILGIDRFMSEARSVTNFIGNGVAAIVVARWENELDTAKLAEELRIGARAGSASEAVESMDGEEMHRFALELLAATVGWPLTNDEILAALSA